MAGGLTGVRTYSDDDPVWKEGWTIGPVAQHRASDNSAKDKQQSVKQEENQQRDEPNK